MAEESIPVFPVESLCFVIGPIGKEGSLERKHSDLLLNAVIKQVLETKEFGYSVKRADEDADPGMIGDRIVTDIINAPLVVADLTDLNPNALYELGIRHSTQKPTIHLAKLGTVLPFDTSAHRTIFIDLTDWHSIRQASERLAESARAIKRADYRVSNPITQANASFKMRQSEDPKDRIIADMQERLGALENTLTDIPTDSLPVDPKSREISLDILRRRRRDTETVFVDVSLAREIGSMENYDAFRDRIINATRGFGLVTSINAVQSNKIRISLEVVPGSGYVQHLRTLRRDLEAISGVTGVEAI